MKPILGFMPRLLIVQEMIRAKGYKKCILFENFALRAFLLLTVKIVFLQLSKKIILYKRKRMALKKGIQRKM